MYLVFIKFIEMFTRAALVVGVTYSLGLADAGRFGVTVTLIGLFAFAFGWERQIDIQRRTAGSDDATLDRAVADAIPFWAFNQAWMLPVFVLATAAMARLSPLQLLLAVLIVSGEQIANQTYHVALVARRYWSFQLIVATKNCAVLLAVLPHILLMPSRLTLTFALAAWAVGQTICVGLIAWLWRRRSRPAAPTRTGFDARILAQHRVSFTHFKLGVVAVLSLQFDRLTVGGLTPLSEAGTYFRHVLIVSLAYQFFNVASYNRILPRVLAAARTEPIHALLVPIRRELAMVAGAIVVGASTAIAVDAATGWAISSRYHLSSEYALLLLAGALLRIAADFASLILNARHLEGTILRNQLIAFAVGGTLMAALTFRFGIIGTAVASVIASGTYLALMVRTVRALTQAPPAAPLQHGI